MRLIIYSWFAGPARLCLGLLLVMSAATITQAGVVVSFNAANAVGTGQSQQYNQFGLNTTTPTLTSVNLAGYTGPDLYIAINKPDGGAWQVADYNGAGLRVRLNNTSHAADSVTASVLKRYSASTA